MSAAIGRTMTTLSRTNTCRTDLVAVDCSPDLFAHRFYVLL